MPTPSDEHALLSSYMELLEEDECRYLTEHDCRRFLRARKWNVPKAAEMTHEWWVWYNAPIDGTEGISPRRILDKIEDPNEEIYKTMLPHSNFNFGIDGFPVYWEKTGCISSNFGEISKVLTLDDLVIRHIRQQEMAVRRMQFWNEKNGTNVEKQIIVFDLADLSYSLHTVALAAFRKTLQIDQDYYPERLHTLVMINAPWFFTALWAVVKIGIDPVTANKMYFHFYWIFYLVICFTDSYFFCRQIVGSSYISTLRELVADENIPTELGGSCENMTWQWPFPDHTGCDVGTLSIPLKNELKYASVTEDSKDNNSEHS